MRKFHGLLLTIALSFILFSQGAKADSVTINPTNSPDSLTFEYDTYNELGWTTFTVAPVGIISSIVITYTWTSDYISEGGLVMIHPDNTTATIGSGLAEGVYTTTISGFNGKSCNGSYILKVTDSYGDGGSRAKNITITVNYTVPPMTYTSSNVVQVTGACAPGSTNAPVLQIPVVMAGVSSPMSATSFSLSTNGSLPVSNITNAKLYYTGTSATFATTTQFGSTVASPSGAFTVAGSQALSAGTNYFWLVYDVASAAAAGSVLDAECSSITIGGTSRVPTTTAPTGLRTVKLPLSGTYSVAATGANYTTLSEICSDISSVGLAGNVNISVAGSITETNTINLSTPPVGASYTISIKPATGTNPVVTYNHTSTGFIINGVNNLTIDGSNTVGGTTKNLTFTHTGVSATAHVLFVNGGISPVIKNCKLIAGSNTGAGIGLVLSNVTNPLIQNNDLYRSMAGIWIQNATTGAQILKNTIGNTTVGDQVQLYGIYLFGSGALTPSGYTIAGNTISGMFNSTANIMTGISLNGAGAGVIEKNKIMNMSNTTTLTDGSLKVKGFECLSATTGVMIRNNLLTGFSSTNSTNNTIVGILINGSTNIYFEHNTMAFGSNCTAATFNIGAFLAATSGLTFRNNIFTNESSTSNKILYYASSLTTSPFTEISGNVYYSTGSEFSRFNSLSQGSLSAWATALGTGSELNSITKTVSFASLGDAHLGSAMVGDADMIKPILGTVAQDMDGETRTAELNYAGCDIVDPAYTINQNLPATLVACKNNPYTMSVNATVTSFADGVSRTPLPTAIYTWKKNGYDIPAQSGITVNNNTLNITSAQPAQAGAYYAVINLAGKTVNSNTCTYTVNEPIAIASAMGSIGACWGGAPTVTLSSSVTGTVTGYQWQKQSGEGWDDVEGATQASYTIPLVGNPDDVAGLYRYVVYGPSGCGNSSLTSNTAEVVITLPLSEPSLEYEFDPSNICENSRIEIEAEIQGTITGYQWQKKVNGVWSNIDLLDNKTAQAPVFVIESATPTMSGDYRVIVSGSPQCVPNSMTIDPITLTIWAKFKFDRQPESQTICEHETIKLTATGVGNVKGYKWLFDGTPIDIVANPTAKTAFLAIPNAGYLLSGTYSCVMTVDDCLGIGREVSSDLAQVYVMKATEITRQPKNATIGLGGTAVFEVQAHHKGKIPPSYMDKYQWFTKDMTSGELTAMMDGDRISGANSSLMSISEIKTNDYSIYSNNAIVVVVEGVCGNDTSNAVMMYEPPQISITGNPVDAIVCSDKPVSFEVEAQGSTTAPLAYKWYFGGYELSDAVKYSGLNSAKLTINNADIHDAGEYYAEVSNAAGGGAIQSTTAVLTVNEKPTITTDLLSNLSYTEDSPATMTVVAIGTAPFTYQWYKDDVAINGATAASLSFVTIKKADAGTYSVKVINDCGEVMSSSCEIAVAYKTYSGINETGNGINLQVNPNPIYGDFQISYNANSNDNVMITVNDMTGKELGVVYSGAANDGVNVLNINTNRLNLISGTYALRLAINGIVTTKMISVMK